MTEPTEDEVLVKAKQLAQDRVATVSGPSLLDGIEAELAALSELRDKPAGSIRITTGVHAAQAIVWPALAKLLPGRPRGRRSSTERARLLALAVERVQIFSGASG